MKTKEEIEYARQQFREVIGLATGDEQALLLAVLDVFGWVLGEANSLDEMLAACRVIDAQRAFNEKAARN